MSYKLQQYFKDHEVKGISTDSRKVKPGHAFFAIPGQSSDGNNFIKEALNNGASIAFTDKKTHNGDNVVYVDNIIKALSNAANIFYPKMPSTLIAVTGTNGKSSVVSYCMQIIENLGEKAACMGSLGVTCQDDYLKQKFSEEKYKSLNTPDSLTFRSILNDLAEHEINYLAFEASSHGIYQRRIYGIKANLAAFTSFSQDHLDYHKSMEDYLEAKLKLFSEYLDHNGLAVINSDISVFPLIKNFLKTHRIRFRTVGTNGNIKIINTIQSLQGQTINFSYNNKSYSFFTKIIGSFQASNILIAALLVHKSGFEFDNVINTLPNLVSVKGRLQRITNVNSAFHVFVDYAHTPDALERSLTELLKIKKPKARLIAVFGCGGNRDKTKRPIMGTIASKLADYVIITDDNPRKEDPVGIRKEILSGCKAQTKEIGDRKEAIFEAVKELKEGDLLLIAGKGHEDYQIIKDKKIHFDDEEIAREALVKKRGIMTQEKG